MGTIRRMTAEIPIGNRVILAWRSGNYYWTQYEDEPNTRLYHGDMDDLVAYLLKTELSEGFTENNLRDALQVVLGQEEMKI